VDEWGRSLGDRCMFGRLPSGWVCVSGGEVIGNESGFGFYHRYHACMDR
jgi:hypothetical protein